MTEAMDTGSKGGPGGRPAREQLEALVAAGMTLGEIAAAIGLGRGAVRHWLGRYGLRTLGARRAADRRAAEEATRVTQTRECPHHGETVYVRDRQGAFRCRRCRSEAVSRRRRRVKQTLVAEADGACLICGYDRYVGALSFHHLDPDEKRLAVSMSGVTLAIDFMREEAQKCVLLCANCHAEVEGGLVELPVE